MNIKNIEIRINFEDDSFLFFDQVLNTDKDKSGLADHRGYLMNKDGSLIGIIKEGIDRPVIGALELLQKIQDGEISINIVNKELYDKIKGGLKR